MAELYHSASRYNPRTANINGISTSTGWKLHFDPINNNPETFNAIESHLRNTARIQFKGGSDLRNNHGEGKSYTAYPQSLEERDRVIAALHHKDTGVSHLLAPANPVEGNMQFTDNITGRFTTGYNFISPSTGEIDWSRSLSSPQEGYHSITRLRETGEVNHYIKDNWNNPWSSKSPNLKAMRVSHDEIVEDIASLKTNHPAVHELMVGKPGYNSPYPVPLPGVSNSPSIAKSSQSTSFMQEQFTPEQLEELSIKEEAYYADQELAEINQTPGPTRSMQEQFSAEELENLSIKEEAYYADQELAEISRSNTPKPVSDSKQSVLNSIDKRQAARDRTRAKNQQKIDSGGVPKNKSTLKVGKRVTKNATAVNAMEYRRRSC